MHLGPKALLALAFAFAILPAMSETEKRAGDEQPKHESAAATKHEEATPPIDCPLHAQGADMDHLKPFDEVEEYIAFLERPDREIWQRPDAVVGAGSGYFTFRIADALPEGTVRAIDIEPEMLRHIHHKATSSGISNIEVVVASPDDPHVAGDEDLVFICDVLHHVEGREAWLERLYSETKPGARIVLEGDRSEFLPYQSFLFFSKP